MSRISLNYSPTLFNWQNLSLKLRAHLTSQLALGDPLSLPSGGQITGGPPCLYDMYEGSGHPNSSPQVCMAECLNTEQSLQHLTGV